MGDQLGYPLAELALAVWALLTTGLAAWSARRRRRVERERDAVTTQRDEAARERDAMATERDYWREQSLRPFPRPPAAPRELAEGALESALGGIAGLSRRIDEPPERIEGECGAVRHEPNEARLVCSRPLGHEGLHDSDGYQWRDADDDGTRYAELRELPKGPADRPVQFDETPTDPGKRKPP